MQTFQIRFALLQYQSTQFRVFVGSSNCDKKLHNAVDIVFKMRPRELNLNYFRCLDKSNFRCTLEFKVPSENPTCKYQEHFHRNCQQ